MRDPSNSVFVSNSQAWRKWLEENHASWSEVWLIFNRAYTGKPNISYEDAIEEALCFGWVDSIIQKVDEGTYARKFTPRKKDSRWSESNVKRVAKLIREGRMTEAGLAKIPAKVLAGRPTLQPRVKDISLPLELEKVLKSNPKAWENFTQLPPSQRRNYVGWITSAKKKETIERRLNEAITLLAQNKPLGLK